MSKKRKVEIFTAGCPICDETVQMVRQIACPSCDVEVLNTQESAAVKRAMAYGLSSLPAVVVDGKPAECCADRGVDEATLRKAGVGTSL